uniref:Prostaglandin E synthase 3 n=1 Tax=Nothoprocta perdicaria TaxID=30464 RepID=A0A8C7E7Y7_NOTPE
MQEKPSPAPGAAGSWCSVSRSLELTRSVGLNLHFCLHRQPASAKWYDRRDYVFIEFCVEDSKDVNVNFEKSKLTFSCLGGSDNFKHLNEIDLFNNIDPNSKHKRTDRSILCCLRKGESGQAWPRLTKERAKLNWLSVDFNNWKDWEDDSDEDMSNFDRFSEVWGMETGIPFGLGLLASRGSSPEQRGLVFPLIFFFFFCLHS